MINPLYLNDLDDMPEVTEESRQRFQVVDMASLSWVLRKMRAIEAKRSEINGVIDAEIERLKDFRNRELEDLQNSEDFFHVLIGEFAIRQRDEDPSFKSMKTPYGSIGFRKQQPKWHYEDEIVVSFLEYSGRDDLIRIKKEPIKTELKKAFKVNDDGRVFDEDGIEVDGITVEFLPEELTVKVEI